MASPLGRSHGHPRADLVTVTGQVSRPPPGRTQWPLTFETADKSAIIGNENARMWLTAVTGINGTTSSVGNWSDASPMGEQVTLLNRTGITLPDVSTTYTPNLRVTLPTVREGDTTVVDVQAGEYSATLTQSLY